MSMQEQNFRIFCKFVQKGKQKYHIDPLLRPLKFNISLDHEMFLHLDRNPPMVNSMDWI